ncbi:MAG: hypothetical protein HY610_03210, partial [Elusimicrobia bacterium]|nr:hypothetical protein [Elusimicrobiota bacterium]
MGTSSLKVGLVNLNGEIVVGPLYQFYSIQSSEPRAATLNADVLLKSVLIACRKTLSQNVSGEIVAASLSVFMHSFM